MPNPLDLRRKCILLEQDVLALDVTDGVLSEVKLPAGTEIFLEIGKFEWLGRDGLYSEFSVSERPGRRYRARLHRLMKACKWPVASWT